MNSVVDTVQDSSELVLDHNFTSILPQHLGYSTIRSGRYPSVGNQLEAIWEILKDIPAVAEHPSFIKMQEKISEVKEQFPKSLGQGS